MLKNNSGFAVLKVVIFLLIIVAAIGFGFWLGRKGAGGGDSINQEAQTSVTPDPAPSVTPEPSPTPMPKELHINIEADEILYQETSYEAQELVSEIQKMIEDGGEIIVVIHNENAIEHTFVILKEALDKADIQWITSKTQ